MITASPAVYTVSKLNSFVKAYIDSNENLTSLFVVGEISNFKAHYTGHLYMTIKDEKASIKAVMFAGNASRLRFRPENGMRVLILGSVSLFERDGSYQLYITDMQPDGVGSLEIALSQLKEKLSKEGLFNEAHKKQIPFFPRRVGVITAETGAAVRDIINVIGRRCPACEIVLKSVAVQGDKAAKEIADAIALFNELSAADVLIVGRGGGSLEELWAFNEEIVARAVYASKIPVISAVGHETDYTVCDFVADLRAPTPSAAAELAVPDSNALKEALEMKKAKLFSLVNGQIGKKRESLLTLQKSGALKNPALRIADDRKTLLYFGERLDKASQRLLEKERESLMRLSYKLDALSPLKVISRGYAAVFKDGEPVTDIKDVSLSDNVKVKIKNGAFCAKVIEINGEENEKII